MKKKKILVVMMNLNSGGAEKSLINFFSELNNSKYEIDLLLFQKRGLFLKQVPSYINILEQPRDLFLLYNKPSVKDFFSVHNIKLIFLRYLSTLLIDIKYKNKTRRVKRQIRWDKYYSKLLDNYEKEYDISLSYLENEPMRYVIDKTKAAKKYVWFHSDYLKLGLLSEYDNYYYEKADKIVTISEECLKTFNEVFPSVKEKTIYIPNISSSSVISELAKNSPPIPYRNNTFKIVSIGRLSYEKGFDIAIEAAKLLKNNSVDFQWYLIGDGIMKKELIKKIKSYHLTNCFSLIGVTENPYSYINSADILVQTSRTEGKSMVLDEAKILNKPFVVTKYPSVFDQANEEIAIIVDISAEAVAKGIMDLYYHKDKIEKMKNNLAQKTYSNEFEIQKYQQLFDE